MVQPADWHDRIPTGKNLEPHAVLYVVEIPATDDTQTMDVMTSSLTSDVADHQRWVAAAAGRMLTDLETAVLDHPNNTSLWLQLAHCKLMDSTLAG